MPLQAERTSAEQGEDDAEPLGVERWRRLGEERYSHQTYPEPEEIPPGPYPIPEQALYDRKADPRELVDVSSRDVERVKALQAALRAWMRGLTPSTDAQSPLSPERIRALSEQGYAGGDEK